MSFSLRRYFSNLFISIVIEDGHCYLLGHVVKQGKITKTLETIFENPDPEKLDEKVVSYLEDKEKEYSAMYVAYYLSSIGQGAIPGTDAIDFDKYSVDLKNVSNVYFKKAGWSTYASYIDIKSAKSTFDPISLDLLYSPFILINYLLKDRETSKKPILYMYNHKDSLALAVFKEKRLLFGAFFKTSTHFDDALKEESFDDDIVEEDNDWQEAHEEEGVENLIELDNIEEHDDEFESLDDIESLENVDDEIEEFHEEDVVFDEGNIDEFQSEENLKDAESSIELFGRDMVAFKYIKSSIEEFYHNENYESDFIQDLVIFDNHEMSKTVLNILESELMIKVEVENVKTLELMIDVAKKDVKL